ncbi:3'-5' exoribonuclease YhaM family protein [Agrilactobacillus fermenti]|uniref:3'-5' exoribonuclease YhaM family protein n=1 Tax=Agrilactobacillus fermenti TaxID=2586909 RepID=UPI001E4D9174|nr:HD domain-containing protein [Agrilactobacillus fermenti]MCD2255880.1 HD domain-containing protein [Agrilactobacillus fermenti]
MTFYDIQNNSNTNGTALFQEIVLKTSSNGKPFASGFLVTKEKRIPFKIWDASDTALTFNNKVVDFNGKRSDYNDTVQFTIDENSLSLSDNQNLADFLPSSYWDITTLKKDIRYFVEKITDPDYNKIVNDLYKEVAQDIPDPLFDMPAAIKMHHAFIGGLYTHAISMCFAAEGILKNTIYKTDINESLLYAGILLHDLGKAYAYTNSTDHEESKAGNLLEHIAIIDGLIVSEGIQTFGLSYGELLKNEKFLLLRHLVLSHHGRLEWGAAIKPATPEATLLHQLDLMDSRMEIMREVYDDQESGSFSDKVFGLDGTRLYKNRSSEV